MLHMLNAFMFRRSYPSIKVTAAIQALQCHSHVVVKAKLKIPVGVVFFSSHKLPPFWASMLEIAIRQMLLVFRRIVFAILTFGVLIPELYVLALPDTSRFCAQHLLTFLIVTTVFTLCMLGKHMVTFPLHIRYWTIRVH